MMDESQNNRSVNYSDKFHVQKVVQHKFPMPASNTNRKMGSVQLKRSKGDESPMEQHWTTGDGREAKIHKSSLGRQG
jgi:hypothetical protein